MVSSRNSADLCGALLSVNICREMRVLARAGGEEATGHFKTPVAGRVPVGPLGVEGDHIADAAHHGGAEMAVYALSVEVHRSWGAQRGAEIAPGGFGENLTVQGLDDREVCIGDAFRVGDGPLLQVSVPRAPCWKLGVAMGDAAFPKAFLATCRVGFYLRVLEAGVVGAGDAIVRESADPAGLSVAEVTRLMYFGKEDRTGAGRAAGVGALKASWREEFARRAGDGPSSAASA